MWTGEQWKAGGCVPVWERAGAAFRGPHDHSQHCSGNGEHGSKESDHARWGRGRCPQQGEQQPAAPDHEEGGNAYGQQVEEAATVHTTRTIRRGGK